MDELSELEQKILKTLTEKPNVNITELSKVTNKSRLIIRKKLKKLNEQLNLEYVLGLNEAIVGLNFNILISIKLKKYSDEIKNALLNSSLPCFAALTKGDFDMLIYVACKDSREFDVWELSVRKELCGYLKDWRTSLLITKQYGFFPLPAGILGKSDLKTIHKRIFEMLMQNSRASLTQIAEILKISKPLAKYHIKKLEKNGYFKRILLIPGLLPNQIIIFRRINTLENFKELNTRSREFLKNNQKNLCFHARLLGTFDHCTIAAFETVKEMKQFEKTFWDINKKRLAEKKSAVITKILFGKLNINPYEKQGYLSYLPYQEI